MSEKSGGFYKCIPSVGHLMTLVGGLSGIGAIFAGTLGRTSWLGTKGDNGFNWWGNLGIALANAIPAFGIFFNAKEIRSNPNGLPKIFKGLNGKDIVYDSERAGIRQMLASLGYLLIPFGGLQNRYVASLFDMVNGLYFSGAAEEELPNTTALCFNILRKGNLYTESNEGHTLHDFSS